MFRYLLIIFPILFLILFIFFFFSTTSSSSFCSSFLFSPSRFSFSSSSSLFFLLPSSSFLLLLLLQATCSKPPAVALGSLPSLFLDFGPHVHVGLFPALVRALGPTRVSFVNFQPRRSFAAWTYYDDTDVNGYVA